MTRAESTARRHRQRRRHWRRLAAVTLAVAVLWGFALGCTSTVTPPAEVRDPVLVHLIVDARHHGLLLPAGPGGFVEYGYGDWDWYARMHDSWYHAFDTVLWPTQGTLGRRITDARDDAELRERTAWAELVAIRVERAKMVALRDELAARYHSRIDEELYNATYRMSFVPVDDGFWCCYNCHDAVADWLRALGCAVSWVPIRTGLRVAGSAGQR